ncbi:hypothetical protein PT974_00686 [Cladobotryum mycophilum]|uniref:F-box domain-containing protein n=1 Tax=Cladobotryum mycophilum TaxID=491253 RepID=A0ABR0T1K1_9HYPO
MDQFFTPLWDLGSWFGAPTSSEIVDEKPTRSTPFLDIPADVMLLITDQLDAPSALSLAHSCKSLYALNACQHYKQMRAEDQKEFLLLLERDPLGKGTYYCHPCNKLHPFQQTWGPHSESEISKESGVYHCGNRDRFSPIGNAFDLSFTHAKLVMNNHFYGPEYGVPIENLCIEHDERRDATNIHCITSAKILDDELFIQRTYTFTVTDSDVQEFRKCTGARDFRLCEHTSFFSNNSIYRQYVPELQRRPSDGGEGLVACREVPGSCGLCLMDYDITINPSEDGKAWLMTIQAYHQVGSCRSPDDWKWARFTESCRPHLFFPNRPNRRGSIHNPGTVRIRWSDEESQALKAAAEEASKGSGFWSSMFPVGLW